MELLKQLEAKVQVLVQQRNQLKDELAKVQADRGSADEELRTLRRRVEDLSSERDALLHERQEVKAELEAILKRVEELV